LSRITGWGTAYRTEIYGGTGDWHPEIDMGFRQFSLRGNVKGELNLAAMAWNLKRMFILVG